MRLTVSSSDPSKREFYGHKEKHDWILDSITEQTLDELDMSGCIAFVEAPVYERNEIGNYEVRLTGNRAKEFREVTDIDLAIFDLDNRLIGAYEVKSQPGYTRGAEEALKEFKTAVEEEVCERYDLDDWRVTGHVVETDSLNDPYLDPGHYPRGIYGSRESLHQAFEDRDFVVLTDSIFRSAQDEGVYTEWQNWL